MVLTFYPTENKYLICLAEVQFLESELLSTACGSLSSRVQVSVLK